MPEIDVSFDLECALCGEDLEADLGNYRYRTAFKVMPCPACFATDEGEKEG